MHAYIPCSLIICFLVRFLILTEFSRCRFFKTSTSTVLWFRSRNGRKFVSVGKTNKVLCSLTNYYLINDSSFWQCAEISGRGIWRNDVRAREYIKRYQSPTAVYQKTQPTWKLSSASQWDSLDGFPFFSSLWPNSIFTQSRPPLPLEFHIITLVID